MVLHSNLSLLRAAVPGVSWRLVLKKLGSGLRDLDEVFDERGVVVVCALAWLDHLMLDAELLAGLLDPCVAGGIALELK